LPPYSFEVFAIPFISEVGVPAYYRTAAGQGMNPIGVIHDLMTSKFGKLGIDEEMLDLTSFTDAAVLLALEENGYSRVIYDLQDASALIQEILDQVHGVMYADVATGKYTIKLIRNDYTVASLPLFNQDNVIGPPELQVGTWEETYNEVRIKWTDRDRDYTQAVAMAQDAANVYGQNERLRFIELDFPGICDERLAHKVAARELKLASTPLRRLNLTVDRSGHTLRPGGLFRFTWPEYNIVDAVFRVGSVDFGLLDDNRIQVVAVEDVFSLDGVTVFDEDPENHIPTPPPFEPFAIQDRLVVEMPRFLQVQADTFTQDRQHLMHWAHPADDATAYRARVQVGPSAALDVGWRAFHTRAKVETTYARTAAPYDTTTGLRINNFVQGPTFLGAATTAEIQGGKNLVLVGGEIIAYESTTDIGGGVTRLNNVWRGLLDTVPVDHAIGELVYFLPPDALTLWPAGLFPFAIGTVVAVKLIPRRGIIEINEASAEEDLITITERIKRPYPGANFKAAASNAAITSLEEEGLDLTWLTRDLDKATVTRGDTAAEVVPADVKYFPVVSKPTFADVTVAAGNIVTNPVSSSPIALASASRGRHGQFDLKMRTIDENSGFTALDDTFSWQDPRIPVFAHRWRNLLVNGRFAYNSGAAPTGWTAVSGSPIVDTVTANSLGINPATARYVKGNAASTAYILDQKVYIPAWLTDNGGGGRLVAVFDGFTRNLPGDAGLADQTTITLATYNISDVLLTSTAFGPTTDDQTWTHRSLTLAIPNATEYIKVTLRGDSDVENGTPFTAFAECILRLGHVGAQLLLNPDFESGLTSWTTVLGDWSIGADIPYINTQYVFGGTAAATAELRQDVAIPAGFEYGTAILECARCNNASDADDTGEVILEALNAGGTVIATTTTGIETLTVNVWVRRRLKLNLPAAAVTLRTRLRASRVTDASACNSGFDDMDLRVHKGLDPDLDLDAVFTSPPVTPIPLSVGKWSADQANVPAPNHALWNGSGNAGAIINDGAPQNYPAALIDTTNTVLMGVPFVGPWNGTTCVHKAYEFLRAGNHDLAVFGTNTFYQRYGSTFDWSVAVVFRVNESPFNTACGLVGKRVVGGQGWSLSINSTGQIVATLQGTLATITKTGSDVASDGLPHMVVLIYKASTNELFLAKDGVLGSATSTAGMGTIGSSARFRIGRSHAAEAPLPGQISRVYGWYGTALTSAHVSALWKVGSDSSGKMGFIVQQFAGACVVKDPSVTNGIAVARVEDDFFGYAWDSRLAVGGASGWGLAMGRAVVNLISQDFANSAWFTQAPASSLMGQRDVEGLLHAVQLTGDNTAGIYDDVDLTATATVRVTCFAKAITAGPITIRVQLLNTNDVSKGTVDVVIQSTRWTRVDAAFTGWDDSTASGRIRLLASASGASQVVLFSSPIVVHQGAFFPLMLPFRGGADAQFANAYAQFTGPLTAQLNVEGEIRLQGIHGEDAAVAGTLVEIANAGNNNDARFLGTDPGQITFIHYDGVAGAVTSEITPAGGSLILPWTIKARWARTGVVNDTGALFAGLHYNAQTPDYDRVATWTPTVTTVGAATIGASGDVAPNAIITRARITARELGPGLP
jgi:hypothetical protein